MAEPHAELQPHEAELRGDWIVRENRSVAGDPIEQRIAWLTAAKLQEIARDWSGWDTLYRDPRDGRLWELTYPQSEMHGGGPRRLHILSREEATQKYANAAI